jgi:ankyrin repeat protein
MSPLNMACNRKNSEVAKLFIQAGSYVNLADDKDNIPLHYVARNGDADVALALLDAGQSEHFSLTRDTAFHPKLITKNRSWSSDFN